MTNIHFKAEGDVEFKALMFVPKRAPWDFYDQVQRPKKKGKFFSHTVIYSDIHFMSHI